MSNYTFISTVFLVLLFSIFEKSESKNLTWDYLVYTQQWPPALCYNPEEQKCIIPKNSTIWTIHGLWPDRFDGNDVSFCNSSWIFNISEIESLVDEMDIKWPSLIGTKNPKYFWAHEWEKHGTCAAENPQFNTMLKYFSKALSLHDEYNINGILSKAGFLPDTQKIIETDVFVQKVNEVLGKNISVECSKIEGVNESALSVVELFFDRDLNLIDSTEPSNLDCKKTLVYWPYTPNKINDEL